MKDYDKEPLILKSYNKMLNRGIVYIYMIFAVLILFFICIKNLELKGRLIFITLIFISLLLLYLSTKIKDKERIVFKNRCIEFYEGDTFKRSLNLEIMKYHIKRPYFKQGFLKINFKNIIFILALFIILLALNFHIAIYILLLIFILGTLHKFIIFKSFKSDFFTFFPVVLLAEPLEEVKNNFSDKSIKTINTAIKTLNAINSINSFINSDYSGSGGYMYRKNVETKCYFVFIDSFKTYNELKFYLLSRCSIDIEKIDKTFL